MHNVLFTTHTRYTLTHLFFLSIHSKFWIFIIILWMLCVVATATTVDGVNFMWIKLMAIRLLHLSKFSFGPAHSFMCSAHFIASNVLSVFFFLFLIVLNLCLVPINQILNTCVVPIFWSKRDEGKNNNKIFPHLKPFKWMRMMHSSFVADVAHSQFE